jgi:hypothetical protein
VVSIEDLRQYQITSKVTHRKGRAAHACGLGGSTDRHESHIQSRTVTRTCQVDERKKVVKVILLVDAR